jgi:TPR repeat protein
MCRLCRWIEALLFSDASGSEALGGALWDKAWDRQYAFTHDEDVLDTDPDLDALREAERLSRSDPEAAVPLLRALADRGSAWSAMLLGYAYQRGLGVPPDPATTERWYRLAVERGCRQAQLRLGRIYQNRGDLAAAENVYAVGVAEQWAPAMYNLARLRMQQVQTPTGLEEVRSLLEQAAARDDLAAQMYLSRLLARGRFGWWRIPRGLRLLWRTARKLEALERKGKTVPVAHQHAEA